MKISPITYKTNFGYKFPNDIEQTTYDGDDLSCQEDRKFIRERLFANFPYNEEHKEYRVDPTALKYLIINVTKTHDLDKVNKEIWAKRAEKKEAKERKQQEEVGFHEMVANMVAKYGYIDSEPTETTKIQVPKRKKEFDDNFDSSIIYNEVNAYSKRCISDEVRAYRGSMVDDEDDIDALKRAGIKTLIDLRGFSKKDIEGITHFTKLNTADTSFWTQPAFYKKDRYIDNKLSQYRRYGFSQEQLDQDKIMLDKEWEESKEKVVNTLVEYVDLVNQGKFYIGCNYGTHATTEAIALNNAINPKTELIGGYVDSLWADRFLSLLGNFNDEDKKRLGLTPEIYDEKIAYGVWFC